MENRKGSLVKKLLRITVIGLIVVMVLPSLVGPAMAQDGSKVLVTAYGVGDPRSIDPQQAIDTRDLTLVTQLFPGVTWQNEETKEGPFPQIWETLTLSFSDHTGFQTSGSALWIIRELQWIIKDSLV